MFFVRGYIDYSASHALARVMIFGLPGGLSAEKGFPFLSLLISPVLGDKRVEHEGRGAQILRQSINAYVSHSR